MTEPREPTDQLGIGATDMTDNTQPDAGSAHIIRYALEMGLLWIHGDGRGKVREALAALDALEAQRESIAAGGVSGPLMGQPQEMPDLSALTERGAKAWAGVDGGAVGRGDIWEAACVGRNDLEPLAAAICPVISDILKRLSSANPAIVRMSGSGATCFALFDDAASLQTARTTLNPHWWSMASMLR